MAPATLDAYFHSRNNCACYGMVHWKYRGRRPRGRQTYSLSHAQMHIPCCSAKENRLRIVYGAGGVWYMYLLPCMEMLCTVRIRRNDGRSPCTIGVPVSVPAHLAPVAALAHAAVVRAHRTWPPHTAPHAVRSRATAAPHAAPPPPPPPPHKKKNFFFFPFSPLKHCCKKKFLGNSPPPHPKTIKKH